MADPFQPVRQGQTLDLSARTFNGLLRAGQDYSRRKLNENGTQNRGPGVPTPPRVYNGLTAALGAFSVVQTDIDAIQVDPSTVQFEASGGPVFNAITPVADGRPFFITQEPIPVGGIGDVVTNGPAVVWVDVTDEAHGFAAVSAGVTECLVSSASGGVPILWKETGTGLRKAEVMLGSANPLPAVRASEGTLDAGVGYTLLDAGTRTVPRGDYLAISTFGVRFDSGGAAVNAHFALGVWDASIPDPPSLYYIRTTPYRATFEGGGGGSASLRFQIITLNQGFTAVSQTGFGLGETIKIGLFYKTLFGVGLVLPDNHSLSLIPCSIAFD